MDVLIRKFLRPLDWPEVRPGSAGTDAARRTVYGRVRDARELPEGDRLRSELLAAVLPAHESALSAYGSGYRFTSRLQRSALVDPSNAVVTFAAERESRDAPDAAENTTFVYALARCAGRWRIVKAYQLTKALAPAL